MSPEILAGVGEVAAVAPPNGLIIGQTTVVTVCVALMIWMGLLARPSRATLIWTLAMILALLGSYGSLASVALGIDVLRHPVSFGLLCGVPALVWSGLRATARLRPHAWIGLVQSVGSFLALLATTEGPYGSLVFRVLVLGAALGAAPGAIESIRDGARASRHSLPLVVASCATLLVATVGLAGSAAGTSAASEVLFVRAFVMIMTVYVICATVSLLFIADRRAGASDVLKALDTLLPVPVMRTLAQERLRRAAIRHEQTWSFIDIRLDDDEDLRDATGEAAHASTVARFERIVSATFPADADICRVAPGHVTVLVSQSFAAVRELVRTVLNETSAGEDGAPVALGITASAGVIAVDPVSDGYADLAVRAAAAVHEAQQQGGDRWVRVGPAPATA